jgi:two-component system, NarL family, nitrate/nitrite response regulator NarL
MRVCLVGAPGDRSALRQLAAAAALDVVAEYETIGEARVSRVRAEAILLRVGSADSDGVKEPLTPREIQVVELLVEGLPNKAIAARLGISDQTVKFHVSAVCGKLGAANRTDAVRRAIRRGVVAV